MRTTQTNFDKVTYFDANVYKQERQLVKLKHTYPQGGQVKANLYVGSSSSGELVASYQLDTNKEVTIDVSDIIRAYPTSGSLFIACSDHLTTGVTMTYTVVGMINPDHMIIPALPYCDTLKIVAPTAIYACTMDHLIEFRASEFDEVDDQLFQSESTATGGQSIENGCNTVPSTWTKIGVCIDREMQKVLNIRPVPCGARTAVVEWVGATGCRKRATWLVSKHTVKGADATNLLDVENDYNQVVGREESFTIYLDGLNRYDFWYYSDIATSSEVKVSLDGSTFDRVQVASKSVTIPDGDAGEFNTLEMTINWHQYDAITM